MPIVDQTLLAAGDVSSGSMSASDKGAESIYRHCLRLTNRLLTKGRNRNDSVLDIYLRLAERKERRG